MLTQLGARVLDELLLDRISSIIPRTPARLSSTILRRSRASESASAPPAPAFACEGRSPDALSIVMRWLPPPPSLHAAAPPRPPVREHLRVHVGRDD